MIEYFFFQAEDGIRDWSVTGVQTCALPIYEHLLVQEAARRRRRRETEREDTEHDDQPDEAREDEGQERQRHQTRFGRKDAKAPKGQVEPAGELGTQSGFQGRFAVGLPTPLR